MKKSVKLVWATPDTDKLLAYIARVSNPANQENKSVAGLLRYMEREGHVSPFTMCNMCVEVNTSRAIGRQILRHWTLSVQEFCISGDSKILVWGDSGKMSYVPISKLYEYQADSRMRKVLSWNARVFDEASRTLIRARIKEVFKVGEKEVFTLRTSDGKSIKSTINHRFMTPSGWKELGEIQVGDLIGVNGLEVYKSKEWMEAAKARTVNNATGGVSAMAAEAGVSYSTIRKWLKVHGIQFSKSESYLANGSKVWNRGLPSNMQPMWGKTHSEETRTQMHTSSRKGEDSPLFRGGKYRDFRQKVFDFNFRHRHKVLVDSLGVCNSCGCRVDKDNYEIDHEKPAFSHPELAFDYSNLRALCLPCHREKSKHETIEARKTVRWKEVTEITSAGIEETFDMEVDNPSHNYVANGLIVHNSQRYQDVTAMGVEFDILECRMQDAKDRQNSLTCTDEDTAAWFLAAQEANNADAMSRYQEALARGVAKEQARCFLPEGNTPSRLYLNGNFRSWIHYLRSRLHPSTQKEHREIAAEIAEIFEQVAPVTYAAFFGDSAE